MNPEKQRIAIAEACLNHSLEVYRTSEGDINISPRPDYCNDLNAMHEAERVLTGTQKEDFLEWLGIEWSYNVLSSWEVAHATAAQRAEAFLKTIGKWKEER